LAPASCRTTEREASVRGYARNVFVRASCFSAAGSTNIFGAQIIVIASSEVSRHTFLSLANHGEARIGSVAGHRTAVLASGLNSVHATSLSHVARIGSALIAIVTNNGCAQAPSAIIAGNVDARRSSRADQRRVYAKTCRRKASATKARVSSALCLGMLASCAVHAYIGSAQVSVIARLSGG
jgi:hypothetical protein